MFGLQKTSSHASGLFRGEEKIGLRLKIATLVVKVQKYFNLAKLISVSSGNINGMNYRIRYFPTP